ncbi:MAG: serine hydrolase domain-containing protein, partial [Pyrinomonadaceae bacterium]
MSNSISTFLQERIDAGDFPSAVYLVAENGEIRLHEALGYAVVEPERIEARIDTIYDVASLTKVLVTGLLAAQQIEDGELSLASRLGGDAAAIADVTVEQLATHTSGLTAWKPLYILS